MAGREDRDKVMSQQGPGPGVWEQLVLYPESKRGLWTFNQEAGSNIGDVHICIVRRSFSMARLSHL